MSGFLKEKFLSWINEMGSEAAAEVLDCEEHLVNRWASGGVKIPLERASDFVEKVLIPSVREGFASEKAKAVQDAIASLNGEQVVTQGMPMPENIFAKKAPQQQPTPAPTPRFNHAPPVPAQPTPPPAPTRQAPPVGEVVRFEGEPSRIEIPANKSEGYISKFIDIIAKQWPKLPTELQYKMRNVFFPWEGRDLFIAFPCQKFTNPVTASVLVALALDLGKARMRYDDEIGDANPVNARNRLAHKFMQSDCKWMLFIDDDMIPPVGRPEWWKARTRAPANFPDEIAGRHCAMRLSNHGKTLVGGLYFGRHQEGLPLFHEGIRQLAANSAARDLTNEVRPTEWVATGCLMIHRSVFLDIQRKFPDLAPKTDYPWWNYFYMMQGMGEDESFCRRAKEAGHQPYVDLGLVCGHVGYNIWSQWNTRNPHNYQPA